MKAKHLLYAAIAALILAQIIFSAVREPSDGASTGGGVSYPAARPSEITGIALTAPDGAELVSLARVGGDWTVSSLGSAPGDQEKIDTFLSLLLEGEKTDYAPPADRPAAATGLDDGEGVIVKLRRGGRDLPGVVVGLRPGGEYEATFVKPEGGAAVSLLAGDLRGAMGLWRNQDGARPDARHWLKTDVLVFDPDAVRSMIAVYPDHRLEFMKNEAGEWEMTTPAPGGAWNPQALADWLRDLAAYRIVDVFGAEAGSDSPWAGPSHGITLIMADGSEKTVAVAPNRYGEGMLTMTSDYPERVYLLPDWRFSFYFQRTGALFPDAAPVFALEDVRFVDIHRGGDSVKLARRDEGWNAVAVPYPVDNGKVEAMLRLVSAWHPEDFADARPARPGYGGPSLEIALASGDVHQYRLGGRHPVFPWRYVLVDGSVVLTADERTAGIMFPEFIEILQFGRVFDALDRERLETLEIAGLDGDGSLVLRRIHGETAFWEAETAAGETRLDRDDVDNLIAAPLLWKVAGVPDRRALPSLENGLRLHLSGGGVEQTVLIIPTQGKDVPYVKNEEEVLLLSRTDFFPWLAAVRGLAAKIAATAAPGTDDADAATAENETGIPQTR